MNPRRHFIFLTLGFHPDQVGGAFRYVAEVATRLAARGHRVDVIGPNPNNKLPASETRRGVTLRRFANGEGFFWTNWRRENAAAGRILRELLARANNAPLVVGCHAFLAPAAAEIAAAQVSLFTGPWAEEFLFSREARKRTLPKRCFDSLVADQLRAVERAGLARARRILTISEYYVAQLPQWHPVALPPIEMISGGVDAEVFQPATDRDRVGIRAKLGVASDAFVFLTVRRLDPRMGLLTLLEAFARARHGHPHARLWIAGTGPQGDELKLRAVALGLGDSMKFLGFVPDAELPDCYPAADCTVVPSLALEGFGLVTAEALACGTPVLGSDSGATPELLAPLGRQLLFAPGSVEALAAKFREVLANPGVLPSREHCRAHAVGSFSWERPVNALEQASADFAGGTR